MTDRVSKTWAARFRAMSHEDRVMTIIEDGSTLDALLAEALQEQSARAEAERERDAVRLDLDAQIEESRRLLRDRDAFWLSVEAAESRCREVERERDEARVDFESLMRIHTALTADAPPEGR